MIPKVRCVDATAKQLALMSNYVLKKSPKFAEQAIAKKAITSKTPRFNSKNVKTFYNISDFFDKENNVKEAAKPLFKQILKDFGLRENATLPEFMHFIIGVYK